VLLILIMIGYDILFYLFYFIFILFLLFISYLFVGTLIIILWQMTWDSLARLDVQDDRN